MKRYLHFLLLVLALATAAACKRQSHDHAENGTSYTCPMHPQIVQSEPGTCPICNMDLVAQSGHSENIDITEELRFLLQPTTTSVVAQVATVRPLQKTMEASLQLEGMISYDPRQLYTVPTRVGGRIERLYVRYNFQRVRKGQPLLEIYSPELTTAQQELLYLVKAAPEDHQLQEGARQKLRLLGATNAQINNLIRRGKVQYSFTLYSPHEGYVTGLNTTAPAARPNAGTMQAGGGGDAMSGMGGQARAASPVSPAAPESAGQDLALREGMYVSAGQPLLRVVNPSRLWAEFNATASEVGMLKKGTPVQISFPQLPEKKIRAQVDFVQPYYQQGENFATVRVYLPGSPADLMVGQLVSAELSLTLPEGLWVPQSAVLDLGTRSVAFKKTAGVFQPVALSLGARAGKEVQVLGGLQPQDQIARKAQYLIDSESFIKVNHE